MEKFDLAEAIMLLDEVPADNPVDLDETRLSKSTAKSIGRKIKKLYKLHAICQKAWWHGADARLASKGTYTCAMLENEASARMATKRVEYAIWGLAECTLPGSEFNTWDEAGSAALRRIEVDTNWN